MKYIQGKKRAQISLFPVSLDDAIDPENEIRVIDLFVAGLKPEDYGFKVAFVENGRTAYHPADLLKLYIYGYLNKIRSSRDPEKECKRNIEVMWLLNCLKPDHNTISNFRRDNPWQRMTETKKSMRKKKSKNTRNESRNTKGLSNNSKKPGNPGYPHPIRTAGK